MKDIKMLYKFMVKMFVKDFFSYLNFMVETVAFGDLRAREFGVSNQKALVKTALGSPTELVKGAFRTHLRWLLSAFPSGS